MEKSFKWGNLILALVIIIFCSTIAGFSGYLIRASSDVKEKDKLLKDINKSAEAEIQSINEKLEIAKLAQAFGKEKAKENQVLTYNSDFYTLDLPKTWEGYSVKNKLVDIGRAGTGKAVDFGFARQPFMFNIVVLTKDQWEIMQKEGIGNEFTYLVEDTDSVYLYSVAKRAMYDELAPRLVEIDGILKTFVFRPIL